MKTVAALILKDIRLFLADKVSMSLTFVVPVILIFVFGSVFSNTSQPRGIHLAFINNSKAPVAEKLEKTLDTMKAFILVRKFTNDKGEQVSFDTNTVKTFIKAGNAGSALVIPEDAYSDTSLGLKLKYYFDPKNDLESQMVQGLLQKTIMEQIPSVFTKSMQRQAIKYLGNRSGRLFNSEIENLVEKYFPGTRSYSMRDTTIIKDSAGSVNFFSDMIHLEKQQLVGKNITNPIATRSVGGWAVMFLLFSISASAASLFDEKKSGVILRILSSPVKTVHILWSKYLFNIGLGIIHLSVMFIAGYFIFRIDIFSNAFNLLLLILAGAMVCTAFGMLLAAFSKSSAQASGWSTFLVLLMSSIGGAWWPSFLMPEFIQFLGKLTFVFWTIDGFLKVLWSGAPFSEILPNLSILLGIAVLLITVSLYQFKRGNVFDNK